MVDELIIQDANNLLKLKGTALPKEMRLQLNFDAEWCLQLIKDNLKDQYERAGGWSDKAKIEELSMPDMWFLVIDKIGFASFLFDYDVCFVQNTETEIPVLYLYELQISNEFNGNGWGTKLMNEIERIAAICGMNQVTLTVFKSNLRALRFYQARGYSIDSSCPSNFGRIEPFYIMSKAVLQ